MELLASYRKFDDIEIFKSVPLYINEMKGKGL